MKKNSFSRIAILGALFVLAVASACSAPEEAKQENEEQEFVSQGLSKTTIPIEGMTCNACVASVKKKLKSMDGLREVEVSLEHRNVTLTYNPTEVTPAQVQQAINEVGYKAGEPVAEGSRP